MSKIIKVYCEGKRGSYDFEILDKEHCIEKARELILTAKAATVNWTTEKLKETVEEFLGQFDDNFFNREDYLIWFQGKDLVASLKSQLPGFPVKSYFKYTLKRFNYQNFPDLVQLRDIVRDSM
jgi:hypothetical protein